MLDWATGYKHSPCLSDRVPGATYKEGMGGGTVGDLKDSDLALPRLAIFPSLGERAAGQPFDRVPFRMLPQNFLYAQAGLDKTSTPWRDILR